MKVTQYTKGKQARFQIIVPVMLQHLTAYDGKKINRTASVTRYVHLEGDTLISLQGTMKIPFGKMVDGKPEIALPGLLRGAHEAYKEYKKPAVQKALEAIIHHDNVLSNAA
jgi:hypothetical protein